MSFISFHFIIFFSIVIAIYPTLPHKWQNLFLLIASYIFYGWWDWRFLGLIGISSLVDYYCAITADPEENPGASPSRRKLALIISVITNLTMLGIFKYFGFFVDSLKGLIGEFPLPMNLDTLNIILPVGISFYTFQSLSYTVDVYRGKMRCTHKLDDFLLFVAFFPQLVAGPIERARRLLPQIQQPRKLSRDNITEGAQQVLLGFFKKMVIADNLAVFVNSVFNASPGQEQTTLAILLAVNAFAFQIYADFSGYTDIARGSAKILGFDLCKNFNAPYLATNPSDFWQRWHISLSSWLRDYLYIPLGGNRKGKTRTYINLSLTMLLGGLWHGAAWNFVLWGAYHGLLLSIFHQFISRKKARDVTQQIRSGPTFWLKAGLFYQLTCFGWLLFRAKDFDQIKTFLMGLFNITTSPDFPLVTAALLIASFAAPLLLLDIYCYRSGKEAPWKTWSLPSQVIFHLALFYSIVLYGSPDASSFIYFQF